jgi:hypothetical protein
VQLLGKGEQAAAIRAGTARKHDGEASHEEGGTGSGPFGRIESARSTERQEAVFVVA